MGVLVDGSRGKICGCWGRTGVEKRAEENDLAGVNAEGVDLIGSAKGLALS